MLWVMFKDVVVEFGVHNGVVLCFLRRLRALWGERVVRKYCARSVLGVVGGHAVAAICGRMWW